VGIRLGRSLHNLTSKTGRALDTATESLIVRIETYHADFVCYQDKIATRRNETIRQLELLELSACNGDQNALDELRNSDKEMLAQMQGTESPGLTKKVEGGSLGKLATLDTIRVCRRSI